MALAYTAPTWVNGSGTGISASQLQALSDCMEGIVQGSDKAITDISMENSIITLTFADGSEETATATGLKGISSIAKTGTVANVDTYTITYTDGTSTTFTVTNGLLPTITVTATADGQSSDNPTVTVTKTGTDEEPNFAMAFSGLKGQKGDDNNISLSVMRIGTSSDPQFILKGNFYINGVLATTQAYYEIKIIDEQGIEIPLASSGTFTGNFSAVLAGSGWVPLTSIEKDTIQAYIYQDSTKTKLLAFQGIIVGENGVSPEVTVTSITGGHRVNITDEAHPQGQSFDVMDGTDGQDGTDGTDGVSPEVTITTITGGHRVNITDAEHPSGQNFDVMDGTGSGDMQASTYDPQENVANAGGIPNYVSDRYSTADTAETTLADDDKIPFYDDSASEKRSSTWSNIKAKLKSYFDGIYSAITAIGTYESGSTASRAYAVGEHFYKDGKFCTIIAAVASGETWTLNTNYVEGTIADNIICFKDKRETLSGTLANSSTSSTVFTYTATKDEILSFNGNIRLATGSVTVSSDDACFGAGLIVERNDTFVKSLIYTQINLKPKVRYNNIPLCATTKVKSGDKVKCNAFQTSGSSISIDGEINY